MITTANAEAWASEDGLDAHPEKVKAPEELSVREDPGLGFIHCEKGIDGGLVG